MSKGILQFPVTLISDEMRIICQSEVKPLEVDIWLKQPLDIAGIKLRMEANVYSNLLNTSAHAFGYEM